MASHPMYRMSGSRRKEFPVEEMEDVGEKVFLVSVQRVLMGIMASFA